MIKKKAKLGSGERFREVMMAAEKGGAQNPAGVAAAVGRKKYGDAMMARLAAAGKKK